MCSSSWTASAAPSRVAQQDRARQRAAGGDQNRSRSVAVGFFEKGLDSVHAVIGKESLIAGANVAAVEATLGAASRKDARLATGLKRDSSITGCRDDDLRQRMIRAAFGRGSEREHFLFGSPIGGEDLENLEAAGSQRPCFVEDDSVDFGSGL